VSKVRAGIRRSVKIRVNLVFGRPFVKRFVLCYRTVVLSVCLSCLSCPVLTCLSVTLVHCDS